jgi:hypothetical protein
MDKTFHDRASERPAGEADAADRPGAAPDGAEGSEIVTVCAWCPALHILKMQRRETDVVIVYQQGKRLMISRNGMPLTISHGICPSCKAGMK